ncbi:helicase associated domain-containing protein [Streptomyces viridosporus]|uniref:helicase associated domain-containing protein n=1 Tax=Streptomyces viridosporus TaxID=67581 RepID=UPI003F4CDBE0
MAARDQVVDADGSLPDIAPGMLFDGDDLGRWLKRQKQPGTRKQLSSRQQERLARLGIKPAPAPPAAPTAKSAAKGAPARRSKPSNAA